MAPDNAEQNNTEQSNTEQSNTEALDLSCQYAGIKLRSPIIVASGPLANSPEKVKALAAAGAGAVVLRSLFEEDASSTSEELLQDQSVEKHAEAYDYIREMGKMVQPDEYMDNLAEIRRHTDIPVIASLNGSSLSWWQDYAYGLERAGASAIELNLGMLQLDPELNWRDERHSEKQLLKALGESARQLSIPLTLKVPPHMCNALPQLCRIASSGVEGMVYFNRYYLPDIDLKTMEFKNGPKTSDPIEFYTPLRYLALHAPLLRKVKTGQHFGTDGCDIALTTGVHSGEQILKALLVGAAAVQICSVLIQKGPNYITTLIQELSDWMREKQIKSLTELRMRYGHTLNADPEFLESFQRLQYVRTLR